MVQIIDLFVRKLINKAGCRLRLGTVTSAFTFVGMIAINVITRGFGMHELRSVACMGLSLRMPVRNIEFEFLQSLLARAVGPVVALACQWRHLVRSLLLSRFQPQSGPISTVTSPAIRMRCNYYDAWAYALTVTYRVAEFCC